MNTHRDTRGSITPWTITGLVIVVLGGIIFISSGYGYQDRLWHLWFAMNLFMVGTVISGLGVLICSIGLVLCQRNQSKKNFLTSISGIVFGMLVISTFLYFYTAARIDPPIHDITTDTTNPPQFEVVPTLRSKKSNPCKYGGESVAQLQEKAYPFVRPLLLDMSFENTFHNALAVARSMKRWKIVNSNATAGKIEATVTTPWFGLKEDVVVRVSSIDPSRSKIDVRSESRLGVNDLGTNARRIHTYLTLVRKESFDSD